MYYHEIISADDKQLPVKIIIHQGPDTNIPRHWHRSLELSFTLQGSIDDFFIGDRHYKTKAGDLLMINSDQIHSVTFPRKNRIEEKNQALTILFPYAFCLKYIPKFNYRTFAVQPTKEMKEAQEIKRLQQLLTELFQIKINRTSLSELKEISIIFEVLYWLCLRASTTSSKKIHLNSQPSSFEKLDEILSYIQDNLKTNITLASVSDHFGFSYNYFSRFFKNNMGIDFSSYVNRSRTQEAFRSINENKFQTVKSISQKAGFSNQQSFIREFKNNYDITPGEYIKKLRHLS